MTSSQLIVVIVFFWAIAMGFITWGLSVECSSKWENSGMQSKWGPIQGCIIKLPDGRWIPSQNYREF